MPENFPNKSRFAKPSVESQEEAEFEMRLSAIEKDVQKSLVSIARINIILEGLRRVINPE